MLIKCDGIAILIIFLFLQQMISYVRKIWTQDVLFIFMINFLFKKIKHPVGITENYLIDINFMH